MYIKKDYDDFNLIKQNITKLIKDKMNEQNLTQQSLSDLCHVSRSTVQKWCENTCPTADKIPVICKALDISVFELLGIDNPYDLSEEDIKLLEKIKANPTLKDVVERY